MADTFSGGTIVWDVPGIYDGIFQDVDFSFSVAGTYDFRLATFVGTTDLINTSGGAVIVKLPPAATYTNTGPDITTQANIAITITNANLIAGSRVQLYNVTQDTELENTILVGAGYSYAATLGPGQEVEDGDVIRLRATYANGINYKENYEESAAATESGITFIGIQDDWTAANSLGLDGSTFTQFAADYANTQIDITASGNVFNVAELIAFILYAQTSEDGVRTFFNVLRALDAGNWRIQSGDVDLRLDNTKTTTATQADALILMRDDNIYPQVVPTTGGGGIGMIQSGQVYIVETGVSGLTPTESAQLLALPSAEDTADAVRVELAPELSHIQTIKDLNEADEEFSPTQAIKRHRVSKNILLTKNVSGVSVAGTINISE